MSIIITLTVEMLLLIIATTRYIVHPFLTLILAASVIDFIGGLNEKMVIQRCWIFQHHPWVVLKFKNNDNRIDLK